MTFGDEAITAAAPPAPASLRQLPRLVFSRRWWWTTLLVFAGVALMARLGVWQLDRLEQRRAQNAELVTQLSAEPAVLTGDEPPEVATLVPNQRVVVSGSFDFDRQILLTQQSWQGRPGAHLITPLVLAGGDKAILVDRGWIPSESARGGDLSLFDVPESQTVTGSVQLAQTAPAGRGMAPAEAQVSWYRVDIEAIEAQMPYELLPLYVLQSPDGAAPDDLPYRAEPSLDLSDGPHLGYALQWFAFTLLLAAGYLYYVWRHSQPTVRG
jgi:surfeit locus 1 family protein